MKNFVKYKAGYFVPPEECLDWAKKDNAASAPIWCSVDLRDGNQALIVPMSLGEKTDYYKMLVEIGFKEIEAGSPAASESDYAFVRTLIENDLIPEDVTIQVLTQPAKAMIKKTFESLKGARKAIVHLYTPVSAVQREQVFKKSKDELIEIAREGAYLLNKYARIMPETEFMFEYTPESFTGTETEFALLIANEVIDIWKPSPGRKVIINLPATVEMSMPHVYASQIEFMCKHLHNRENLIISLHPHNDRGTAVAAAELGLLAGADRIEGTLFGNGERAGNVDIVTLAMNLFSHGVDPGLEFSHMPGIVKKYEWLTDLPVHPRQPYSGKLVFTAFTGSHNDAIKKGLKWRRAKKLKTWSVPYLPIDPADVGGEYKADVIRRNSQSGKGAISFLLENNFGFNLPMRMREEVGYYLKNISDYEHKELSPDEVLFAFEQEYINRFDPIDIIDASFSKVLSADNGGEIYADVEVVVSGERISLNAVGSGRLDAVSNALKKCLYIDDYTFVTYSEHALDADSFSRAAAYVAISDNEDNIYWGVGIHKDIVFASISALISAINRQNYHSTLS